MQRYMNLKDQETIKPLVKTWFASRVLRATILDRYAITGLVTQRMLEIDQILNRKQSAKTSNK